MAGFDYKCMHYVLVTHLFIVLPVYSIIRDEFKSSIQTDGIVDV